jgi:hypothetical protein
VCRSRGTEYVKPYDGPAERLEMIVDVKPQAVIASAPIRSVRPIDVPRFCVPTIEDDIDGRIVRKRALYVLVELLSVPSNDQKLLDRLPSRVLAVLQGFSPALGERLEP